MTEEREDRDKQVRDMEERSKELERDIDEAERDWEARKQKLPGDYDEPKPVDEDNPVGGV